MYILTSSKAHWHIPGFGMHNDIVETKPNSYRIHTSVYQSHFQSRHKVHSHIAYNLNELKLMACVSKRISKLQGKNMESAERASKASKFIMAFQNNGPASMAENL